jgi:hypothetical protein
MNSSDSQGVKTQRRNLQHGEDDMRLVFGVMISLSRKAGDSIVLERRQGPGEIFLQEISVSPLIVS